MANDDFYILSLRWTRRSELITWWCPNNSGYTSILEQAGRYTRAQVEGNRAYYDNGRTTIAVPCDAVDAVASRTVFDFHLERLTGKRFTKVFIEDDNVEPCESCGYEPPKTDVGLRVVGEVAPHG